MAFDIIHRYMQMPRQFNSVTEDPRYNDSVCYQRFCCKIEFAVIKKFDMDPSKALVTDSFEQFFYKSYVLCICKNRHGEGDSNKYPKRMFSQRITCDCQ